MHDPIIANEKYKPSKGGCCGSKDRRRYQNGIEYTVGNQT